MSKKLSLKGGIPRSRPDLGTVQVFGGGDINWTEPYAQRSFFTDGSGTNGNDAQIPYSSTHFGQTNNISVFSWVKIVKPYPTVGLNYGAFSHANTLGSWKWLLQVHTFPDGDTAHLRVTVSSNGTDQASAAKIYDDVNINLNDGAWHHIGFTFSSNTLRLYVDGVESTGGNLSIDRDGTVNTLVTSTANLHMNSLGIPNYFRPLNGWSAGQTYWSKQLTSAEVTELYNGGLAYDASGHSAIANLEAFWPINNSTNAYSTTIIDTINGNNASINGTTPYISTNEAPPSNAELSFTQDLKIAVAGLSPSDNVIPSSQSPIAITQHQGVVYSSLNYSSGGPSLTISTGRASDLSASDDILFHRNGRELFLGTRKYVPDTIDLLESVTLTNSEVTSPAVDTWYTPTTTFKITVTEGTWDIGAIINANCIASSGTILSQCALATSSTPGSGHQRISIGSVASDGTNVTRKSIHNLQINEYTVSPGSTVDFYVQIKGLSLSGGTALSNLGIGSYFGSDSVLWARRVVK